MQLLQKAAQTVLPNNQLKSDIIEYTRNELAEIQQAEDAAQAEALAQAQAMVNAQLHGDDDDMDDE